MDVLLDSYEFVNRTIPIKDRRFCITHANFPSQFNLERCKQLGVCADVQPAWLWKDGATQLSISVNIQAPTRAMNTQPKMPRAPV